MALGIGIGAMPIVWSDGAARVAAQWLSVPQTRLLELQVLLSLCILLVSTLVAFLLMVRAYKKLQITHAQELSEMEQKRPVPAASQGGGFATKRSRDDLLGKPWE